MHTSYFSDNKISSVTLAGCFACAIKTLGYDDEVIQNMLKGDHFRITSAFPVIHLKNSGKLHFFPRPHYYVKGIRSHENRKSFLYDFEYISENIFRNFCQKPDFLLTLCKDVAQYHVVNKLCMTKKEFCLQKATFHENNFYKNTDLTHVSINPETGQAQERLLFQTEDHFYSEDAFGFYFLIQHQWSQEELESILEVIAMMGIGKNKSTAKGYFRFTVEPSDSNWHHVKGGTGQFISLSLVHPSKDDRHHLQNSTDSYYRVISRKGKRENNATAYQGNLRIEKTRLFFLQEGSVFNFPIQGSCPSVCPSGSDNHNIYDFGRPYLVQIG